LTTTLGRFVNGDEDDKIYHFNICGTIGRKCNNSNSTVSACMINKSTKKEYVIGNWKPCLIIPLIHITHS
jgi:hypothetical protein